jgi:hypothetical protein
MNSKGLRAEKLTTSGGFGMCVRNTNAGARASALLALGMVAAAAALAQPLRVDTPDQFAWSENTGYLNFAGAEDGTAEARFFDTFAAGFVWGENIGWINLGDGSPADGVRYANTVGADAGVNVGVVDPVTREAPLSGLAWAENVGWINFDTAAALGPFGQHARLDLDGRRLRGYAWGENIGWINLDDMDVFVGVRCAADISGDGSIDVLDLNALLAAFNQPAIAEPSADINGDGVIDVIDLNNLLASFNTAVCP